MKKGEIIFLCYKHLSHQMTERKIIPNKLKIFGQEREFDKGRVKIH